MNGAKTIQAWFCAFLTVEAALYLGFLWLDLRAGAAGTVWLKYAGILLCFAMSLLSARRGGDSLVAWALGLTCAADMLLLVVDRYYALGVLIFLAVQLIYLYRLARADGGRWMPLMRGAVLTGLLVLLWGLKLFRPLNILAVSYFSVLACNMVQGLKSPAPWGRKFAAGLALFACCDLCVGLFNSGALVPAPVYGFVRIGMWLFYLPSQVLIVYSGLPGKEE